MAKTLIVLLLIAGAAYFVYDRTHREQTEEVQLVEHMADRFAALVNKFTSAAGRAGMTGLDTTYDIDSVITQIKELRGELAALRQKLTEERAIGLAETLSEKIEAFFQKNEIKAP